MGRVEGKVVVVTGAARGQGAAEAEALAREGATVVATDVADESSGLSLSPEDAPGTVHYRRLDVSRSEDWAGLADWIGGEHGRVDGLVNNAGITHRARLGEVELADWERVFSVNVTGALLGIQALLPLMPGGGSIVNVGSLAALTGHYTVAYTASKWALRGLSRDTWNQIRLRRPAGTCGTTFRENVVFLLSRRSDGPGTHAYVASK